jgi:hypothetical protein
MRVKRAAHLPGRMGVTNKKKRIFSRFFYAPPHSVAARARGGLWHISTR